VFNLFSYCFLLLITGIVGMARYQKQDATIINNKPAGIWATEWSSGGNYIALGGDDSTVWIYQSGEYRLIQNFRLGSMVRGISWHPGKNLLAVATINGVQLLEPETGKITGISHLKTGGRGIGWNHSGELLALADNNGEIQLMDRDGNLLRTILKHNSNSFLTLDWHPKKNILVTGSDEIMMFDTAGKQLALIFHRDEPTAVLSVKWHPSGKFFASGDYGHEKEGVPTLLQFWKPDGSPIKTISGHHAEIRNLRWSSDGKMLATASDSLRVLSKEGLLLHAGYSDSNIWSLAWSRDCKNILTGCFENGAIQVWDAQAILLKKL
jgi:WD40 repeat protein